MGNRVLFCQGQPEGKQGIDVTIGILQDEFLGLDRAGAHDRRLQAVGGFRGHQHKRNTEEREENARELPAAVLRFELFDARRQEMQFRLGEVHGPPPYDWPGEILTKLDVRAIRRVSMRGPVRSRGKELRPLAALRYLTASGERQSTRHGPYRIS